jgi:hypothetical protein
MADRIEKIHRPERADRARLARRQRPQGIRAWFKVDLEAPFAVGQEARGQITHPGYEHVTWKAKVVAIEPPARFAFTWHPYGIDPMSTTTRKNRRWWSSCWRRTGPARG